MDELTFQRKMQELLNRIKEMPNGADSGDSGQGPRDSAQRRERIKASVSELQESLDYLRLSVKYLVFDLEATRRENNYLRQLLDQATRNRSQSRDEREDEGHGEY